ncbi:MAG: DUF547 domain-containing protein [Candidatus Aminicenantes bacterium]|nr:MAG: DUF547 domain-containing protein [Candidatus Aminicenantes bacterium]
MKKITFLIIILVVWCPVLTAGETPGLHTTWDHLLQKYVKNGMVDYRGFARDAKVLDNYLAKLEKEDISAYSPEQELAFWINAYNAFTVKLILNHYPIKSIKKISNPWGRRVWKVAGQTLSLDHIEHKILRKELKEPRIHFAVVCASIGCPDLQDFAFTADKIEEQLALVARRFFASSKHFYIKKDGGAVIIYTSKIFSWFGDDFGKNKEERIAFMQPYLDKPTADKIKKAKLVKFKYLDYNWNLNGK